MSATSAPLRQVGSEVAMGGASARHGVDSEVSMTGYAHFGRCLVVYLSDGRQLRSTDVQLEHG